MIPLPREFLPSLLVFAPLFSRPTWRSALVLLVGAIPAPGKRTVSAILKVWIAPRLTPLGIKFPTFIDALAWVRRHFWTVRLFRFSHANTDRVKIPRDLLDTWEALLCYAA